MMRSIPKLLALVACLTCGGVTYAEPAGDEAGVQKWLADLETAWNRKQDPPEVRAKGLLAMTAPDFTLNRFNNQLNHEPARTRAQCAVDFVRDFSTGNKPSTVKLTLLETHFLRPDVALVDLEMAITNIAGPDGKLVDGKALVIGTVVKKGGKWLMADARLHGFPQ
jgi:hypothetical protein